MSETDQNSGCENGSDILEAEEEFLRILQTLDADLIMQQWSDSNDISLLFPGTPAVTGNKAVRDSWELVAGSTRVLTLQLESIQVMQCENLGWTFLQGTVMLTQGDETITIEVYVTNIYRLEEGDWKIVHLHATPAPHQPPFFEQRLN